jgi:hypothetical protein
VVKNSLVVAVGDSGKADGFAANRDGVFAALGANNDLGAGLICSQLSSLSIRSTR